ncbi:hypothetical protein PG985_007043 [Apiospora marii]|uniref:DEAD/DEAH box helicase n=1 Tax=Apiospora marii TaxID=335849 RepID=A0ABR1SF72_9PEZI
MKFSLSISLAVHVRFDLDATELQIWQIWRIRVLNGKPNVTFHLAAPLLNLFDYGSNFVIVMASKKYQSTKQLLEWYQVCSSHRLDLVGDFAGKGLFTIDANSLLLHCVTQAKVDFTENTTKYLLATQILFRHLQHHSDDPDCVSQGAFVYEFSRPCAPAFGEYLKANAVRCFIGLGGAVGDGAGIQARARYVFVLYQALRLDVKVAVLDDLEIRNNKIFASVISPSRHRSPAFDIEHKTYKSPLVPGETPVDDKLEAMLEGYSVREKISTAAVCQMLSKDSSTSIKLEAVALMLHLMGMRHWALTDRNCGVVHSKRPALLDGFLQKIRAILAWSRPTSWIFQGTWDLFDLLDGRVFLSVYARVRDKEAFPGLMVKETRSLLCIIENVTKAKLLCHLPPVKRGSEIESAASAPLPRQYLMLPFSQPIFDQYLPHIDLETDMNHVDDKSSQVFMEMSHWHNEKLSLEHKHNSKPQPFFTRRSNQQFMADTLTYSASLTNSTGKVIDPETIVVQQNHDTTQSSKVHLATSKKVKLRGKPAPKTKKQPPVNGRERALKTAKDICDRKEQNKTDSILAGWALRCNDIEEEKSLTRQYWLASRYLGGLRKQDFDVVGSEVLLYICHILCRMWAKLAERKNHQNITVMRLAGLIYHHATAIARSPGCTTEISTDVKLFAKVLRLPDIPMAEPVNGSRSLPFKVSSVEGLLLPLATVEFQLQFCGPYLERGFDSKKDERVPFSPDAWQREVLDAIDADKSLLVIAPTSAGKTFISFYAMKKVLQFDDDGVIVYVAPTKALVNQIAAEIQARFTKTFKHQEGRSVWAIHTRDYRVNNPTGCQILVTVPHILQIMLLSPANAKTAKSWSQRVKRIIFDEVHCIGQSEEGVVWEQLILMATCPIIALSATLGNPHTFYEWLKATQDQHGRSLCMISHDSRYSDLRTFAYAKPNTFKFTGLKTIDRLPTLGLQDTDNEDSAFRHVHPATVLRAGFEPQDCLTLWQAMDTEKVEESHSLDPRKVFSGLISKAQVVPWEKQLKKKLRRLLTTDEERFNNVRSRLISTPTHSQTREDPFKQDEDVRLSTGKYEHQDHSIALPLLCDLHSHDGLPAIIFNHERYECEHALQTVLQELKSSEADYKKNDPRWEKEMQEYKLWRQAKSARQAAAKEAESKKKTKKTFKLTKDGRRKDEPAMPSQEQKRRELEAINLSRWHSFDPTAPLDEFSFADKTKLGRSEFEEMLKPLKGQHVPQYFIDGLRRGLGVHHAGMNRRYRQIVEILFRKGYLRAVFATGTLALGINMPCKTVVFMGDSVFHTALNYRQASGRAGRRGFDLLGNVVFAGIKPQRIFEIMSSRLPDLRGQFALSTTLVLRVLGLLHATKNNLYAANVTKALMTQSRLFLGGPESKMFVQHHLRFSVEYLRRQCLLSRKGAPINLAGLVGHLYFTENAAFAFHALFKEGYFHRLCANIYAKRDEVLEELALVLAHLFSRVQCTNAVRMSVNEGVVSPSILLPNLPADAEEILREHNKHVLGIFTSCATTFARMHLKDIPDRALPYTQHAVGPEQSGGHGGLDRLPPCFLRSPFAALSGHDDNFSSVQDLCSNVRSGVFMEESAIPSLAIAPHDTGGPLNGYLFNFYKHGDLRALSEDNRIRKGSVYIILKEYTLILSTIVASLKSYTNTDAAVDDEDIIGTYDEEMDSDDERGDNEPGDFGSSASSAYIANRANAEHGTLEHVQKAFALLLGEYNHKLWKHAS